MTAFETFKAHQWQASKNVERHRVFGLTQSGPVDLFSLHLGWAHSGALPCSGLPRVIFLSCALADGQQQHHNNMGLDMLIAKTQNAVRKSSENSNKSRQCSV